MIIDMPLKPKVVILTGPTATGKTQWAVALANAAGGEVISADSRQLYQGMDLGTGKDLAEYGGIPHHLIDLLSPLEDYSASRFQNDCRRLVPDILQRHRLPLICGGTGHYLKALLQDYPFAQGPTNLESTRLLEAKPRTELLQLLQKAGLGQTQDWSQASKRRMVRAWERAQATNADKPAPTPFQELYEVRVFALNPGREIVKQRIADRLRTRLQQGMILEVQTLLAQGVPRERLLRFGLEYKWITLHLEGALTLDQLQATLGQEIQRFAKRQMTFLRYMEKEGIPLHWVSMGEEFLARAKAWLAT